MPTPLRRRRWRARGRGRPPGKCRRRPQSAASQREREAAADRRRLAGERRVSSQRAAAAAGGGGGGSDDDDDPDAAAATPAAAPAAPPLDDSLSMGQLGQPPRPPSQLVAMAAAPLSPEHARLLALLRAVDRDDLFGDGGGLAALNGSFTMGQPHSPAAAGAPPPPPAALGPLAQLILCGAAAAGDAPLDADDEPAFDDTAAAAAAAAVELTGGDGHPLPDDWMLVAMGGGDAGAADNDTPADNLAVAVAVGVAVRGADSWRTPEGGWLHSQCARHCFAAACAVGNGGATL